ncbi:MAG: formimidoylglutamase [Phycisphaeraceae bacterium]|nr:formimidoylglutamase [Phycisphaeraceae bacterium]MCW5755312.1 formimidoylglutamase [Phycisphaeraceae bacterium]
MSIPHCTPPEWSSDLNPARFASRIRTDTPDGCAVVFLGLADDLGVTLNGGRMGARDGPRAIRRALERYGASDPASGPWPAIYDAGDIIPGDTLEDTHRRVTEATDAILDLGMFPIGIGGGHDLTFPFVRAAAKRWPNLSGIYCDPHLDVRSEPGSGMTFRALPEHCSVTRLYIQGYSPTVNSREHADWFSTHGGFVDALTSSGPWPDADFFFSFDLDVLDAAYAPGVSAANPCGWTPSQAQAWVYAAGRHPRVRCFDLMEFNPGFDPAGLTARLAGHLILTFLRGFAERPR